MNDNNTSSGAAVLDPLDCSVTDVTGMKSHDFRNLDGHRSASDVAKSVIEELDLSEDTPFVLRDNASARMLEEDRPIGTQIEQNAELTAVPQTHLG